MDAKTRPDAYGALIEPTTLKIQRLLPGPIERVWAYLTESDLRRQWLAAGPMELKVGGELRFASDNGDYAGEALLTILANGAFAWTAERAKDWRERPSDWPETRYERKALSAGAKPAYLSFRRF